MYNSVNIYENGIMTILFRVTHSTAFPRGWGL